MRPTRVLHVILNLNYGGMERVLADIVRGVDRTRIESHVMVLEYLGRFSQGLEGIAEMHVCDPLPRWSLLHPGPLVHHIRRIAPDVVHTHSGIWYKGAIAARRAGVPFVMHTDHGRRSPDPWTMRFIEGLASRRTDAVVAVSDALAGQLARSVVHDPSRIRVIPNGVDTATHRPREDDGALRRAIGVAPDAPVVGSIGRLEPIKGYDVMLEAFALLRARWSGGVPPVLVVGGEGSERARLEATAAARGITDSVRLLGWRDDIQALHASFTLFTMSSRSEGTSVSLLEAMSAGLCPVVTDVGGNAAVLGPTLRHRLVPSGDPAALAEAWHRALVDEAARRADAHAARARVEEAFSLGRMVGGYEALYLEGARRAAPAAAVRPPAEALAGRTP